MSNTVTSAGLLAQVIAGLDDPETALRGLTFEPLRTDGRTGIELHRLYATEQTGPNGPSAAVVRYFPGAQTPPHRHAGFELIYVLDGELLTESERYPKGSLVVMPPGSVHSPSSATGCLLIVVWEQPVRTL